MTIKAKLSAVLAIAGTWSGVVTVAPAQAAVLGGQLFSTGGDVWVQILGGDAKNTSSLNIYSPQNRYIGNNREGGRVVNVGNFSLGQELIFGIFNQKTRNTFLMGPSDRNADRVPHAIVNFLSPGVAKVGFDDGWGAGDWDFNDVEFKFWGAIASAPPRPPIITSLTSDLTVFTNALFDFAATATDPDIGDILTFNWDFDNDGAYDDFTGSSGKWSFDRSGDYPVKLRVTDRYGLYADGSFNVKAVPEPTSGLGLLAFSVFVALLIKSKQQQKVLNSVVTD